MRLTEKKLRQIILSEITKADAEAILKRAGRRGSVIVPLGEFMFVSAEGEFQVETAGGELVLTGRLEAGSLEELKEMVDAGEIEGAQIAGGGAVGDRGAAGDGGAAVAGASEADTGDVLRLTGPRGGTFEARITTRLQQSSVRRFGDDARFWDKDWQATLQKRSDGWYFVPNPGAPNDTLLNGKKLVSGKKLRAGDEIAVGRAAKGIVKLPLTVSFETSR